MFIKNDRISLRQMRRMLMIEIFSASGLLLPYLIVKRQSGNGILPLLLGSLLALCCLAYFLSFIKKADMSYLKLIEQNLDRGGRFFIGILYYLRFFINQVFLMILFGKLIQVSVLPKYTVPVIIAPLLLLALYASLSGFEGRARTLELLFPYIFFPLLLVLFLAIGGIDFSNFSKPYVGAVSDSQFFFSTYSVFLSYRGIEFLIFIAPQVADSSAKIRKSAYISTFLIILLNIALYIVTIGMFGVYSTRQNWWSALNIMQAVRIPGGFVERLDILLIVFWIFSMFSIFSAYYFYGWKMLALGIPVLEKKRGFGMTASLAAVFISVCLLQNMSDFVTRFYEYLMAIDFWLAVFLPLFILKKRKLFQ